MDRILAGITEKTGYQAFTGVALFEVLARVQVLDASGTTDQLRDRASQRLEQLVDDPACALQALEKLARAAAIHRGVIRRREVEAALEREGAGPRFGDHVIIGIECSLRRHRQRAVTRRRPPSCIHTEPRSSERTHAAGDGDVVVLVRPRTVRSRTERPGLRAADGDLRPRGPRTGRLFRLLFQPFFDSRRIASAIQDGVNTGDLSRQPIIDGEREAPGQEPEVAQESRVSAGMEMEGVNIREGGVDEILFGFVELLDLHLVRFRMRRWAAPQSPNWDRPARRRFSLARSTSACQASEGTSFGVHRRSSQIVSIARSLSEIVILPSGIVTAIETPPHQQEHYTVSLARSIRALFLLLERQAGRDSVGRTRST